MSEPQFYTPRGSVGYEFRIARTELTWGDWLESRDAVDASGIFIPNMSPGAYNGNLAYGGDLVVPGSTFNDLPVGGISWRAAAAYCNWLHNNKSTSPDAFLSGAYDFATFSYDQASDTYADQATRSPRVSLYTLALWFATRSAIGAPYIARQSSSDRSQA